MAKKTVEEAPRQGRDCPMCHHPNMFFLGESVRPLLVKNKITGDGEAYYIEFYLCRICGHIEQKILDKALEEIHAEDES